MIIIARIKTRAGKEAEFEAEFRQMIEQVQNEKGTLMYKLVQSAENSTEYAVVEEYDSKESMEFHLGTPYFKEIAGKLEGVMSGPPTIEIFIEKMAIKR